MWVCLCHDACMKVRGQFAGVGSLLPPCGSQVLNSGHWVSWQASSPTEPSYWPINDFLKDLLKTQLFHV